MTEGVSLSNGRHPSQLWVPFGIPWCANFILPRGISGSPGPKVDHGGFLLLVREGPHYPFLLSPGGAGLLVAGFASEPNINSSSTPAPHLRKVTGIFASSVSSARRRAGRFHPLGRCRDRVREAVREREVEAEGVPPGGSTRDPYAIEPGRVLIITDREAHELRAAVDRWDVSFNQAVHALNVIKYRRDAEEPLDGDDADATLNVS